MTNMEKLEMCKIAHEHKDMLTSKIHKALKYEKDYPDMPVPAEYDVNDHEALMFLVMERVCNMNVHEVTRERVWEPLNAAQRAADGLTEPKFMHHTEHKLDPEKLVKTDVSYKMANKDHHKAVNCMLRYIEKVKHHDPQRYNEFMQSMDEA